MVLSLVDTLLGEALWGLPTWQGAASGAAAPPADPSMARQQQQQQLTAQQLGVNVLATRVVIEAVGTVARALGPAFARSGRALRATLLPLLERLGGWRATEPASLRKQLTGYIVVYVGLGLAPCQPSKRTVSIRWGCRRRVMR